MHYDAPNLIAMDGAIADQFDRLPPHSLSAEMCLIGSLMLLDGPDAAVTFARATAVVSRDDFFQADHQVIYDVLVDMRRRPIDAILLCEELISRGVYEEVGGRAYVGQLLNTVPSWSHVEHYARVVATLAKRRAVIHAATKALRDARDVNDDELDAAIGGFSRELSTLATSGRAQEVHLLGDLAREVYDHRGDAVNLIKTGIPTLDRMIGGLPIGGNTIVGGRPGSGKSTIVKQWLWNMAEGGVSVGIISVEERGHKIAENMLANRSGVVNARLAYRTASSSEWDRVGAALPDMDGVPYHVVDSVDKLSSILAMAELLAVQHRCKVIAVDHLHLVDGEAKKSASREQEVMAISGALKKAWGRLGVAGICCCQLNRGSGREKPTMASLRDSGSLEQDGDVIVMVHREDAFRKQEGGELDGILEAIVVKNKTGGTGTAVLKMDEARQRISDQPEEESQAVADAVAAFGVPSNNWRD